MQSLSTKQLIERLTEIKRLPHMPDALIKLNQMLSGDQDPHVDQVAKVIMQDPRLTSGLLKTVNSAKYQMGKSIDTIPEAVARMGVNDLRVIVLAIHYQQAFSETPSLNQSAFLQHSLLSAHIAADLAGRLQVGVGANEAFMLGLMHEIGLYLLLQCEGLDFEQVLEKCDRKVSVLVNTENQMLGFSHVNLGARLLKEWRFPRTVFMGVLGHHAPHLMEETYQGAAYIGFLAEAGAFYLLGTNGLVDAEPQKLTSATLRALDRFKVSDEQFVEWLQHAHQKSQQFSV